MLRSPRAHPRVAHSWPCRPEKCSCRGHPVSQAAADFATPAGSRWDLEQGSQAAADLCEAQEDGLSRQKLRCPRLPWRWSPWSARARRSHSHSRGQRRARCPISLFNFTVLKARREGMPNRWRRAHSKAKARWRVDPQAAESADRQITIDRRSCPLTPEWSPSSTCFSTKVPQH